RRTASRGISRLRDNSLRTTGRSKACPMKTSIAVNNRSPTSPSVRSGAWASRAMRMKLTSERPKSARSRPYCRAAAITTSHFAVAARKTLTTAFLQPSFKRLPQRNWSDARHYRSTRPDGATHPPVGPAETLRPLEGGPWTPEGLERSRRPNWKHGYYFREAKAERSRVRAAILALRYLRNSI